MCVIGSPYVDLNPKGVSHAATAVSGSVEVPGVKVHAVHGLVDQTPLDEVLEQEAGRTEV